MKNYDLIIIGAGPAGLTAGIYSARAGLKVAIVERLVCGGQVILTDKIGNYPGFESINGSELIEKMQGQAESAGCEFIYDEITEIDLKEKSVTLSADDEPLTAKAFIICTGAGERKLGVANEEDLTGRGVHYCALCDGAFYKEKDIVIVGGGRSAVEEVIYLSSIAKSITIVNNTSQVNAEQVKLDRMNAFENLKVYNSSVVTKIFGDKKVEGIEINGKQRIICDGVFVSIGRIPSTDLFKGKIALTKDGYISVNERFETSVEGVFAAGDVIQKRVRQIITACGDGAVAATMACEYTKTK